MSKFIMGGGVEALNLGEIKELCLVHSCHLGGGYRTAEVWHMLLLCQVL